LVTVPVSGGQAFSLPLGFGAAFFETLQDGGLQFSRQPQFRGARLHGFHAEIDVLFERRAQLLRALDDFLAVHRAGEGFVLGFLCGFTMALLIR
jgi:hypothetical protein